MAKRILMVLAQQGFRDEELLEPKEYFERQDYHVEIIAPQKGICKGMLGHVVEATKAIDEVELKHHDVALIVVGGAKSPDLMEYPQLGTLLAQAVEKDLLIGAICLAPMVVASFGIIDNIHATVYVTDESKEMFKKHNITYLEEDVVSDGQVVTANGPAASKKFAQAIVEALARI